MSGILLGYDLCVIATVLMPVQRDLRLCDECITEDASDASLAKCTCAAKQFAVSACLIGAMFGSLFGGALADRIGRRAALMVTDVGFAMGAVLMSCAGMSFAGIGRLMNALFFFGRALVGTALGAAGAVATTYLAEISPAGFRGTLMTLNELALCTGCLLAYLVSAALGDVHWRWTIGATAVAALVQCIGSERPR